MTSEISRRQVIFDVLATGAAGFFGRKRLFSESQDLDIHSRRQVLAERIAKDYGLEVADVKRILEELKPGKSQYLLNGKGEKYVISKSAKPNKAGKYEITICLETANTRIT